MHDHKCTGCKHDCLHYCDCCGKVYCCKCKRKWGGVTWYQPYYPTWVYPYAPYDYPNTTAGSCDTVTCKEVPTTVTWGSHGH